MEKRPLASIAALVVVIPLLLFGGYMGAYYTMLKGADRSIHNGPSYRGDNDICAGVFFPAHLIDRQIRHDYWMGEPLSRKTASNN